MLQLLALLAKLLGRDKGSRIFLLENGLGQRCCLLLGCVELLLFALPLLHHFTLGRARLRMNLGVHLGLLIERVVILHEFATCLFVETRLWEGDDEKAADDLENVLERPLGWRPVPLQCVYANFTAVRRYVRVENLCHKVALRSTLREPRLDNKFATENSSFVGSLDCDQ